MRVRDENLRFGVLGLGFRVQGAGFRDTGFGNTQVMS